MSVRVENADAADLDRLADLWVSLAREQRQHGSHLATEDNRAAIREAMARHLVTDGLRVARAETDDVVGFVTFDVESPTYQQDVTRGLVRNLYVVPDRRDEGVGGRLLDAAEDALADAGVDVVSLEVLADNDAARRFYERRGYGAQRVTMERHVESDTKEGG